MPAVNGTDGRLVTMVHELSSIGDAQDLRPTRAAQMAERMMLGVMDRFTETSRWMPRFSTVGCHRHHTYSEAHFLPDRSKAHEQTVRFDEVISWTMIDRHPAAV